MSTKPHLSNFEALRLVAMLLIVVIHCNFFALGRPKAALLEAQPVVTSLRYVLQSTCIVGVNLFILISGYFGIRTRLRSVTGFLFTAFYFSVVVALLMGVASLFTDAATPLTPERALNAFRIITKYSWFIPAYLGLMLLAPVFNAYIAQASRRVLLVLIVCYAALSIYIGFFCESAPDYGHGHSVLHFGLVYLMARYIRLHGAGWLGRIRRRWLLLQFALCVAANSLIAISRIRTPFHPAMFTIDNPLVLYASLCLFLVFARTTFESRWVNRLAAGAFGVFLVQMHPMVYPVFRLQLQYLQKHLSLPTFLLATTLVVLAFFVVGLTLDVGRRALWQRLQTRLPESSSSSCV